MMAMLDNAINWFMAHPIRNVLGLVAISIILMIGMEWWSTSGCATDAERTEHRLREHHGFRKGSHL